MPAFAQAYSDTEIAELTNYVVEQFGNKQGLVTPRMVAEQRKQQ
jgi:mono/diheme cytochrome c family protein